MSGWRNKIGAMPTLPKQAKEPKGKPFVPKEPKAKPEPTGSGPAALRPAAGGGKNPLTAKNKELAVTKVKPMHRGIGKGFHL